MNKENILYKLIHQKNPIFTVATLNNIAEECEISYETVLRYIQVYRISGGSMHQCVIDIIERYKPELLGKLNNEVLTVEE